MVCYEKIDHYPKIVKIEISSLKILPVKKEGFHETACPKDRQDRSCYLGPAPTQFPKGSEQGSFTFVKHSNGKS